MSHINQFLKNNKESEVYDVSGAGDTVLAVIASCIPNNIDKI